VVHAEDGLDEISIGSSTQIAELKQGEVSRYRIAPEQFGVSACDVQSLAVEGPGESLARLREALDDVPGPARDIVVLNSGAAIYASGVAASLEAGVEAARLAISSGEAKRKLDALVELTNRFP
jgi:anthranilate phosphoribosyltransferase